MTSPERVVPRVPGVTSTGEGPLLVDDAMVTRPKTWPAESLTLADAVAAFTSHVHLLLLVDGDRLVGTLERGDVEAASEVETTRPAAAYATLEQRTVRAGTPLKTAWEHLEAHEVRRAAVVDGEGRLVGLLCLKRHRGGWCSDAGVAARAAE